MGKGYAGAIYVVAASKNEKTEYWVAATNPKDATVAVQLVLGPGDRLGRLDLPIAASPGTN